MKTIMIGGLAVVVMGAVMAGSHRPATGGQHASQPELQAEQRARQAAETKLQAEQRARQAVEAKLQAELQAEQRARQAAETKLQAAEDKLRCELRSFSRDELVALSEADQAEYHTLCEAYGIRSLLDAMQVPFGDSKAGSKAVGT